jgi:hypothetical protein
LQGKGDSTDAAFGGEVAAKGVTCHLVVGRIRRGKTAGEVGELERDGEAVFFGAGDGGEIGV